MKKILAMVILPVLFVVFLSDCGGEQNETFVETTTATPADQNLTGSYLALAFSTDYYDSSLNYIGTLTQDDYSTWYGQLQLGSGKLYQGYELDGSNYEMSGTYSVTYTSGTWEGTLDVVIDGVPDTWDFDALDNLLSTTVYGYDPGFDWYYVDLTIWGKFSDTTTAF